MPKTSITVQERILWSFTFMLVDVAGANCCRRPRRRTKVNWAGALTQPQWRVCAAACLGLHESHSGRPRFPGNDVHFPPCWNLIYSRLPHEMATSSMVCVRCAFAQLLMLHTSSHTSGLINMKPRRRRPLRAQRGWRFAELATLESKNTSRASWRCFGLWWACHHKLGDDAKGTRHV